MLYGSCVGTDMYNHYNLDYMSSIRKTKKRLKRGIANLQWEMEYYKLPNFTLNGEHLYDIVQHRIDQLKQELENLKRKKCYQEKDV